MQSGKSIHNVDQREVGANRRQQDFVRKWGHYAGAEVEALKRFKQPKGFVNSGNPAPQDHIALLIERGFPSMAGIVLASPSDKIHEYLSPENVEKIFALIAKHDLFDDEEVEETFCIIMPKNASSEEIKYYQPDYNEAQQNEKLPLKINHGLKCILEIFLPTNVLNTKNKVNARNHKSREHVDFTPSKKDTSTILHAYEFALLLYNAFKEEQFKNIDYPPRVVKTFILTFLSEKHEKDKANSHCTLLYSPIVEFGRCLRVVDGNKIFYSDCGDSLIRSLFMMFLFNRETGEYEVNRLVELGPEYQVNKKLLNYFTNICRRPEAAETAFARNEWGKVVNDLNEVNDPCPVNYISDTYEVNVGLQNIMRAVIKLLGKPQEFDLSMAKKLDVVKNLDSLCSLFSVPRASSWNVEFDFYDGKKNVDISEFFDPVPNDGWFGFSIIFSHTEYYRTITNIYQMHFMHNHFEAIKTLSEIELPEIEDSPSELEPNKLDDIYESPTHTIEQRIEVLVKIMHYRSNYSCAFNYLLKRWIESKGYYFGGWQNPEVVRKVVDALGVNMETTGILNYAIQPFYDTMVWKYVECGTVETVKMILAAEFVQFGEEKTEVLRPRALTQTLRKCNNQQFSLLLAADGNDYAEYVTGATLLHHAAALNCHHLKSALSKSGLDHNAKATNGMTPLHVAILSGSREMVEYLVASGANVHELLNGKTPLFLVADELDKLKSKQTIGNTFHYGAVTGIDMSNRKLTALINIFEMLVIAGADYTEFYKNNQTYQEWANACIERGSHHMGIFSVFCNVNNLMRNMKMKGFTQGISFPVFIYFLKPYGELEADCLTIGESNLEELQRLADVSFDQEDYLMTRRYCGKIAICYGIIGLLYLFQAELARISKIRDEVGKKGQIDCSVALYSLVLAQILYCTHPEVALNHVPVLIQKEVQHEKFWSESRYRLFHCAYQPIDGGVSVMHSALETYKKRFKATSDIIGCRLGFANAQPNLQFNH